jgi:DNA modification methylase
VECGGDTLKQKNMKNTLEEYEQIINSKRVKQKPAGFEPLPFTAPLFEWQKVIVSWAIKQGRAALFAECGLGKTPMQLEWADQVCRHTGGSVLILAPLAVSPQTVAEGAKFGIKVNHACSQDDVKPGVNITNYERLDLFKPEHFAGVVLDESSILKAFTGKTRIELTNAFQKTPYRLCCTATPAPNDYTEMGQHADFLGVCSPAQMLATYFINDTFNTGDWRLKGHARTAFWEWVATWAACVSKPSDIGFPDDGYNLPALNLFTEMVHVDQTSQRQDGELFRNPTLSATNLHQEMRITNEARCKRVAEIIAEKPDEHWTVWCNTNYEADELKKVLPQAVEIRGSDKPEIKEKRLTDFLTTDCKLLLTKPDIAGRGLNYQHCCNTIFCGLSYSFEDLYQALRRHYRFGQTREVNAYIVQADTEGPILDAIREKMAKHEEMKTEMRQAALSLKNQTHTIKMKTDINEEKGPDFTVYHGDCVRVAKEKLADESIDFSIFSPPFADLFTYSDDIADMGNCGGLDEFMVQFGFLIDELMRVTVPGRECAVHCCDLLATKWKDGDIEFKDFSGAIVTSFRSRGWLLHSKVTIWKDPVTEMQRTKAHGLLYKTLRTDSSNVRVGAPDYLLVFRKPGKNPKPIDHTTDEIPLDRWQKLASPVWFDVDQGNVLNGREAREDRDERHICPLQLDVINNALTLWSAPGDTVFSPFTGIGSEGYCALQMGRKFIGAELKESYFKTACDNLKSAKHQLTLL